jgi:hypothetical protein
MPSTHPLMNHGSITKLPRIHTGRSQQALCYNRLMPKVGVEPTLPKEREFESRASATSATSAPGKYSQRGVRGQDGFLRAPVKELLLRCDWESLAFRLQASRPFSERLLERVRSRGNGPGEAESRCRLP